MGLLEKKSVQYPNCIYITLCVWGSVYWDIFLNTCLLSRLSENNIPLLVKHFNCVYRIYTQIHEIEIYENHPLIQRLKSFISVEFIPMEIKDLLTEKYQIAAKAQHQAVKEAFLTRSALFFDAPDVFFGPDVFSACLGYIHQGKQLIVTPGINLNLDKFKNHPLFLQKLKNRTFFNQESLNSVALETLHQERVQNCFFESKLSPKSWNRRFWRINRCCVAHKGFHLHPFYLWPQKIPASNSMTIDEGEYLFYCVPNSKQHVVCSKPKLTIFELSPASSSKVDLRVNRSFFDCIYWVRLSVHPKQFKWIYKVKYVEAKKLKKSLGSILSMNFFGFRLFLVQKIPFFLIKPFLWKANERHRKSLLSLRHFIFEYPLWNYFEDLLLRTSQKFSNQEMLSFVQSNRRYLRIEVLLKVFSDRIFHLSDSNKRSFLLEVLKTFPDGVLVGKILKKLSINVDSSIYNKLLINDLFDFIPLRHLRSIFDHLVSGHKKDVIKQFLTLSSARKLSRKKKSRAVSTIDVD